MATGEKIDVKRWPNLAEERLGARVTFATDDFFASKENLVKPGRGVFDADAYTDRGKLMDGWESRRKREEGHDYAVIKLGLPGIVRAVDIDTNHFLGNHPPHASIEACCGDPDNESQWVEILSKSKLEAGSQNIFSVDCQEPVTHVRLHIYPDGGVARLKVYGEAFFDFSKHKSGRPINLIGMDYGAKVIAASDMFFGEKDNLIKPYRPISMRDGWETKRRRVAGHDWCVIQLGHPGHLEKVEIDTSYFKGNFPEHASLEGLYNLDLKPEQVDNADWKPLFRKKKLKAHHVLEVAECDFLSKEKLSHVRFNIFPDGGVARLRGYGRPSQ